MAEKTETETPEGTDAVTAEQDDRDAATDAVFSEDEFVATDTPSSRPRGRLAGILALLIACVALAGVGYLAFFALQDAPKDNGSDEKLRTLSSAADKTDETLRDLQIKLADMMGQDNTSGAAVAALEQRVNSRLRTLDVLPGRMVRLERSFSSLQGLSTGVQDTWLLAETEYYMQIANAQLQLAGNPHLATLALRLADERLVQIADPSLTDIRRILANELQALELVEKPDIEGATLTLASLAGIVGDLPLRQEIQTGRDEVEAPDADLSGIDRALASLKGAVGEVVTIRRTDETVRPLMAPDAAYFLRANLSLQLQAARLALLRGEQAVFQQSLDDARDWIEEYYDAQSTPVRRALRTLRDIRESSFVTAIPDISESLRLLRQHVAFNQAAEISNSNLNSDPDNGQNLTPDQDEEVSSEQQE